MKKLRFARFLVIVGVILGGFATIISPMSSTAYAATSQIRATVDNPTVALSVHSVDYLMINGQYVARVSVGVRFADSLRIYLNGSLLSTQSVTYSEDWSDITFDVILPSGDQTHEIIIQASNTTSSTIAEATVEATYPEDTDEEPGTAEGGGSTSPLAPNTGVLSVGTPQSVLFWSGVVIVGAGVVCVAVRRRVVLRFLRVILNSLSSF